MKKLSLLAFASLLFGCPPRGEADCPSGDGGATTVDAGPLTNELQLRVVNLSRDLVMVNIDGQDGGEPLLPLGTLYKTGHVTLIKQRGRVEAKNHDADGGRLPVLLPFEFDPRTDAEVTLVVKDQFPARLSTNMSIERQTPKASFGERVRASLTGVESPGGVDIEGDCAPELGSNGVSLASISLREDNTLSCDSTADAYYARPPVVSADATPYFIRGRDGQLEVAWVSKIGSGLHAAGSSIAQGAKLPLATSSSGLGVVTSGPTRKVYIVNAHAGQKPGSLDVNGILLAQDVPVGTMVRARSNLVAAAGAISVEQSQVRVIIDGLTHLTPLAPNSACKPPSSCDFLNDHDTLMVMSENSPTSAAVLKADPLVYAAGVRRTVVLGSTTGFETKGCVGVLPNDDVCAMGAASVSSQGNVGGIATAAAYAATGRLLYPPRAVSGGTTMQLLVEESGVLVRRFVWDNPPGLTPTPERVPGGFAIVAGSGTLDPRFPDKRALFFVDTGSQPWVLKTALSR